MIPALLFLILATTSHSQFYKSVLPSPDFSQALEDVILDFRTDYRNIQGDRLEGGAEIDVFESLAKLPGSIHCTILRFRSAKDTTAGWQAIMYDGDDFKEAARIYENTFRLVKKSRIKWIDRSLVNFAGDLQKPNTDLRFTSSTLSLQLEDERYKDFEALVELQSTYIGYTVALSLHKKTNELPEKVLH